MNAMRRLIPLVLGIGVVACSDDATGPTKVELTVIANNFESLGRSRNGAGDVAGAIVSAEAARALRSGIRPGSVNITVDAVTEEYMALEVERAFGHDVTESPVLTLPIVSRTMIAWRGAPPERVIAITVPSDTGEFGGFVLLERPTDRPAFANWPASGIMFERDGEPWFAVDGGARSTRQLIGDECPVPRPSSVAQVLAPVSLPSACNAAVFFTRFRMQAVAGGAPSGEPARTRVIGMDGQDVSGIRLQYPPVPTMCPVCR